MSYLTGTDKHGSPGASHSAPGAYGSKCAISA